MRDYYPDFELELVNGKRVHVEVKTAKQLTKPVFAAKYKAIAEHYLRIRQDYRIVTEAEICREPLQTNLRTLVYLLGRKGHALPNTRLLEEKLGMSELQYSDVEKELGKDTTLRLLALGRLECDLTLPLAGDTPVLVSKGERNATVLF